MGCLSKQSQLFVYYKHYKVHTIHINNTELCIYKTISLVCTSIKYVAIRTVRLFIHTRTEISILNSPRQQDAFMNEKLPGLLIKQFVFHPLTDEIIHSALRMF